MAAKKSASAQRRAALLKPGRGPWLTVLAFLITVKKAPLPPSAGRSFNR